MEDVLDQLENTVPSSCVNTHLPVSQVTTIDVIDHETATRISFESPSCPLYPLELNKIRDLSSLYTVLDANKLMRDHNHLKNEFEFTEELPYADGVLAEVSTDQLQ